VALGRYTPDCGPGGQGVPGAATAAGGAFPAAPFDKILLLDVIEQLPDPTAILRSCRKRLRPGGQLIVSFPNAANIPPEVLVSLALENPIMR
jgi:2-polyprenyl-3-methyl-5-hydroxy-6-metoxy-1,4-benzoquinol methylase